MGDGISSYDACVKRALHAKQNCTFWSVLGRTTAWPDEEIPPGETPASHNVDEPICYVKADTVRLCKPVSSDGDITVNLQQYAFVEDEDAYSEGARFIYIHCEFSVEEFPALPYGVYRQHGLLSDLIPTAGHENDQWLAPVNVQNPGVLEYWNNHTVHSFGLGNPADIKFILESM
jgi:hypothetical protein